jgi:hypothetical protein
MVNLLAAVSALVACTSTDPIPDGEDLDFEVEIDPEMVLRARASWSEDVAPDAWVSFGDGTRAPVREAGEAILLGMPPDTEVEVRLEDESGVLAETTIRTGTLPSAVPAVTAMGQALDSGWIVSSSFPLDGGQGAAMVFDAQGRIVWYRLFDSEGTIAGKPPLWAVQTEPGAAWFAVSEPSRNGFLRVPYDGSGETWIDAPGAHHDFHLREDGALAYTRSVEQAVEGYTATGDELVVRTPDGTERVVWNAFDALPLVRHDHWNDVPDVPGDWTHANGVTWNEAQQQWTVSLYWLHQLVVIDDRSGNTLNVYDGNTTAERFGPQHGVRWSGEGWWIFDNGASMSERGRLLHLSPEGTALETWYSPDPDHVIALGGVSLFDWGHILSGGIASALHIYRHEVGSAFTLRWPFAQAVGQAERIDTLYLP